MNQHEIANLFANFRRGYDAEARDALWQQQSKAFREFWTTRVMGSGSGDLRDSEIDEIVRILDSSGKGNTKTSEAVARAMIAQGAWRRMFNQIKKDLNLAGTLNDIFLEQDQAKRAAAIDHLYRINEKNKNNLTGKSGTAVSVMLAAWDPKANLSVASLNHRRRVLDFFRSAGTSLDGSIGSQIVKTNDQIIESLKAAGVNGSARTISRFLYTPEVKPLWKPDEDIGPGGAEQPPGGETGAVVASEENGASDRGLFYLEEELENFLIRNWDQTELGRRYDLIEEDGEMVSQQYPTAMGPIDILAQDKNTKQFVVIELKRDQTSDQTVGQLARYMGWLEENKTKGSPTKGIIIAGKYDNRLYYALKKLKDAEVYLYQVDFKLNEFKER